MQTATIEAQAWWARSREDKAPSWIARYRDSLQSRHRTVIAEAIGALRPDSVLEIGCHCGPNLIRLATEMPHLSCLGVDVSAEAIAAGTTWAQSLGLGTRVQLYHAAFPQGTTDLDDGCVDVVLSCYSLAYTSPADLDAALYECGRLARRAVVLAEPMAIDASATTVAFAEYQEWTHDYAQALKWVGTMRGMTRTIVPVSPPVDRLNAVLVLRRDACAE